MFTSIIRELSSSERGPSVAEEKSHPLHALTARFISFFNKWLLQLLEMWLSFPLGMRVLPVKTNSFVAFTMYIRILIKFRFSEHQTHVDIRTPLLSTPNNTKTTPKIFFTMYMSTHSSVLLTTISPRACKSRASTERQMFPINAGNDEE